MLVLPCTLILSNQREITLRRKNDSLHELPEICHTDRANASICCRTTCNRNNIGDLFSQINSKLL